jgi:hypothetical protein
VVLSIGVVIGAGGVALTLTLGALLVRFIRNLF